MKAAFEKAIRLIKEARSIVVLTGAGISTEAGIPDFRGPGGLWQDPELFDRLSARGFRRDPAGFYRAGLKLFPEILRARPTSAHLLLAKLEEKGKVAAVITQNIDGLHQAAGSHKVFEIHGTFRTGHCTACGAGCDMMPIYAKIEQGESLPPCCAHCRGVLKPDLVLFEDPLPLDVWESAARAVRGSDLMMVMGSSLEVYPAAELPAMALDSGCALVIVNREPTGCDRHATAVLHCGLGDFAAAVASEL